MRKAFLGISLALFLILPAFSAFSVYLKVPGIVKGSNLSDHPDWIELDNIPKPITQPVSWDTLQEGRAALPMPSGSAGRGEFVVSLKSEIAQQILKLAGPGKMIPTVEVYVCRTEGGKPVVFMHYTLKNPSIIAGRRSVSMGSKGDTPVSDEISLNFESASWTYTPNKAPD